MGKVNDYLCDYLGLAEYNADFWNGTVFRGKRRVKIWQLERRDREYYKTQHRNKRKPASARKDVQMLCKGKKDIILAVELMTTLDYSMPVRVMDYDAQELMRQIKDIGQKHRRNAQRSGKKCNKPYINHLSKKDRLIPIHTIVLYCGKGAYDGVANVRELLDAEGLQPEYRKTLQSYKVQIFNLRDLQEENYETSLREIIAMFKRSDSLEAMEAYYLEHKDRFRMLDELSIDVLGALIGVSKLKLFSQEGGGVDMCKAFEDARREGWKKGRQEGHREGHREGRQEGAFNTLCCLVAKGLLKRKDAAKEAGMTEEMFEKRMQEFLYTTSMVSQ